MVLPFKHPFETSFGVSTEKDFFMVELKDDDGIKGYGECAALSGPFFDEETTMGALYIVKNYLIPSLLAAGDIKTPEQFFDSTQWIRRNRMARASVDCALWDLYSKELGISESEALGGDKGQVEAGVSLGIEKTPDDLLKTIDSFLNQGYRRIKCKIKPGYDIQYLSAIRKEFGDIVLTCDANSSYTLNDIDILREIDSMNLLMIEQPLACDDIVDHSHLQAVMHTPICLDESIDSLDDARRAIALGSCRIINIKVSRVGGLTEAKRIQEYAGQHGVYVWCGAMMETGIGRGHNIAAASMPYYKYPNDMPASGRHFDEDLAMPQVYIDKNSMIAVPDRPGMGFEPVQEQLDSYTKEKWEFKR
jgi:O-succinylbenzoate synthase